MNRSSRGQGKAFLLMAFAMALAVALTGCGGNCPNGNCGPGMAGYVGGAAGYCPSGNCPTGNCPGGNCPTPSAFGFSNPFAAATCSGPNCPGGGQCPAGRECPGGNCPGGSRCPASAGSSRFNSLLAAASQGGSTCQAGCANGNCRGTCPSGLCNGPNGCQGAGCGGGNTFALNGEVIPGQLPRPACQGGNCNNQGAGRFDQGTGTSCRSGNCSNGFTFTNT